MRNILLQRSNFGGELYREIKKLRIYEEAQFKVEVHAFVDLCKLNWKVKTKVTRHVFGKDSSKLYRNN